MDRIKTFDATGIAPDGILYSGDLNAIQDAAAALTDFTQTISTSAIAVGESGLQLMHYGSGEARVSGALRTDGIFRGLGGLYTGAFTTTQRNAIPSGSRPYGLVVLNTTTNQLEWNANTDASPTWYSIGLNGSGFLNANFGVIFGADTTLQRTGVATIQLGSSTQSGTLLLGSTTQPGVLNIYGQSASGVRLELFNGVDTQPRYTQTTDGTQSWGAGSNSATDTSFARTGTGILTATNTLNVVSGYQVNSVPLSASHLSNGVTGSGAVVLANAPSFVATPTAPTPTISDNSTKLATTAWVIGQGYVTTTGVAVASVFARTGAITAQIGDYSAAQVTNAADKSSANTQVFVGNVGTGGSPTAVGGVAGTTLFSTGSLLISKAAGATVLSLTAPGDSVYRFTLDNNGYQLWSTGTTAADTSLHRTAAATLTVGNYLNAINGFQVNGVALAASHLSNGVTGNGAIALAGSPTFTGTAVFATINASSIQKNGNELVPPGVITQYAGASAPAGWLICDGSAVSRTTYAALFAAIGTTYGIGDGSSTFNLPDLRNRVAAGKGTSSNFSTLAYVGGEEAHALAIGEMPSHAHTGATYYETQTHTHSGVTAFQNQLHTHSYTAPNAVVAAFAAGNFNGVGATSLLNTNTESANHSHNFSTGGQSANHNHQIAAEGGGGTHNNLQPYIVVNYIIKF